MIQSASSKSKKGKSYEYSWKKNSHHPRQKTLNISTNKMGKSFPSISSFYQRKFKNSNKEQEQLEEDNRRIPIPSRTSEEINGFYYIIVLPLFLDREGKIIKQPFIFKIDKQTFIKIGFHSDLDFFLEEELNLFSTDVKGFKFSFRIIAIGDTQSTLKSSLIENMKRNTDWTNLRKTISMLKEKIQINHDCSALLDEELPYTKTSMESIRHHFGLGSSLNCEKDSLEKIVTKPGTSKSKESEIFQAQNEHDSFSHEAESDSRPTYGTYSQETQEANRNSFINDSPKFLDGNEEKKKVLAEIKNSIDELKRKTLLLSDMDVSGIVLKSLIEVVSNFYLLLADKNKKDENRSFSIPKADDTYKLKSKNLVFIEGKLQLQLDSYEKAISQSKPNNPSSIAYQLVRFAFPDNYIKTASLGRKHYTNEEILALGSRISEDRSMDKIPLVLLFSYPDPFEKPKQGNLNASLGRDRLRALFDHIFRMANFANYTEANEQKVRERIIRELCSRNKEMIRQSKRDSSPHEFENGSISQSVDENSNIFESDFFWDLNSDE